MLKRMLVTIGLLFASVAAWAVSEGRYQRSRRAGAPQSYRPVARDLSRADRRWNDLRVGCGCPRLGTMAKEPASEFPVLDCQWMRATVFRFAPKPKPAIPHINNQTAAGIGTGAPTAAAISSNCNRSPVAVVTSPTRVAPAGPSV